MSAVLLAAALSCSTFVKEAKPETDPTHLAEFEEVKQVAGFAARVILCRMPYAKDRPVVGTQSRMADEASMEYAVFVDTFGRRDYSPAERKAMFAHEFAHMMLPVRDTAFWHAQTLGEYLDEECAADALAATWVGRDGLISALRTTTRLASERRSPGISRQILIHTYRELKLKGW